VVQVLRIISVPRLTIKDKEDRVAFTAMMIRALRSFSMEACFCLALVEAIIIKLRRTEGGVRLISTREKFIWLRLTRRERFGGLITQWKIE